MTDIKKACARCGQPMTVRANGETGVEFLGCSTWPTCTHTEPLPQDFIMRRSGAHTLPGL